MLVKARGALSGTVTVPGDKSISHRSVMFGALAEGTTTVQGFLKSADCLATIDCFRKMGICIEEEASVLRIRGKGLRGLSAPDSPLNAMNSGTTTRLLSGILAGQPFESSIIGDASLSRRPMKRVILPLTRMGAEISSEDGHLPMTIRGGQLRGISYESPVASAQVKSCIALAGLYAEGETRITEPALSRDHTERMLRAFGADIRTEEVPAKAEGLCRNDEERRDKVPDLLSGAKEGCGAFHEGPEPIKDACFQSPSAANSSADAGASSRPVCVVRPGRPLRGLDITVPGDISSAAYFLAAACLVPGSELLLPGVGVNPTRDGMLRVLRAMGADLSLEASELRGGEPAAALRIRFAPLKGTRIGGALIPTLIDELPIIAVLAAFAEGVTEIRDAAELRVKESDRLSLIVEDLRALGIRVEEYPDGMTIWGNGGRPFCSAVIDPRADHRLAMAFAAAGLAAEGGIRILDDKCVSVSYPDFFRDLAAVGASLSD